MKRTVLLTLIVLAIAYSGCKKCYNCQTNYNTIAHVDSVPVSIAYDSVHHMFDTTFTISDTVYNPHGTIRQFQYCGPNVQQYPYIGIDSHHYALQVTSCYY